MIPIEKGAKFGKLVILKYLGKWADCHHHYRAKCECGRITSPTSYGLLKGIINSCGQCRSKHGHCRRGQRDITYNCWSLMKRRCLKSGTREYKWYGGRGIKVCNRWLHSFENFLADMGEKPEGLTLDRIDSNGNYEPGNCRWADWATQSSNRSSNVYLTLNGITLNVTQWAAKLGVPRTMIRERMRNGWSTERTLKQPLRIQ